MIDFEIFFWWCSLGLMTPVLWYVSFSCKLITLIGVSSTKFNSKLSKVGNHWQACLKNFLSFGAFIPCGGLSVVYFLGTYWPCLIVSFIPVVSVLVISFMELTCFLFDFIDNTPHVYLDNFKSDWHVPFYWNLALPKNSPINSCDGNLDAELINFLGLVVCEAEESKHASAWLNSDWEVFSWRGLICFCICGVTFYLGFSLPEVTPPTK